jgi:hypothetical protein
VTWSGVNFPSPPVSGERVRVRGTDLLLAIQAAGNAQGGVAEKKGGYVRKLWWVVLGSNQ